MLKILDGSAGYGKPLSEQDIKDFLTTKVLSLHFGTIDEFGHSNIHPVGYYYDTSNDKFYVLTGRKSKKANNLENNGMTYFCIDDPNPPYKGVRGKGSAKIQEDVNFNIGVWEKIVMRYLGNLEDPMALVLRDELKKGDSIVLEISPRYFSTWDYSQQ